MKEMKYSKKVGSLPRRIATVAAVAVLTGGMFISGVASADSLNANVTATSTTPVSNVTANASSNVSTNLTTAQQHRLQNIISKGNEEINRRLTTLSTLTSKINAATKLTAADKAALSNEVSTTIQGLTGLEAQLDGDTTITAAHTDALSIYTEYRVYALVAPKVSLIKVADDQQAVQANLTTLAQKLQSRITTEQQTGKDVSILQSELRSMNNDIAAAHAISSNIESGIVNLQPTDYNNNHEVLSGDSTQLQNAHSDDRAALNDAKEIVSTLKSM